MNEHAADVLPLNAVPELAGSCSDKHQIYEEPKTFIWYPASDRLVKFLKSILILRIATFTDTIPPIIKNIYLLDYTY